jgi:hypothetical protein
MVSRRPLTSQVKDAHSFAIWVDAQVMQLNLVVQRVADKALVLLQVSLRSAVPTSLQDDDATPMLVRSLQEELLSCQLILDVILHMTEAPILRTSLCLIKTPIQHVLT